MRTIDFSQVLFNALQFSGNDRHNIQPETFAQFRDFASTRLREAWETFEWPDVCKVMPFTATSANAVSELSEGIISVFHANQTGSGNRTSGNPALPSQYSSRVPEPLIRTVLLVQNNGSQNITLSISATGANVIIYGGQSLTLKNYNGGFTVSDYANTAILEAFENIPTETVTGAALEKVNFFTPEKDASEIFAVFDKNPLLTSKATQRQYVVYEDSVRRVVTPLASGWYAYRINCPELTGDLWKPGQPYAVGSQVYFDSGSNQPAFQPVSGFPHKGNFYNCTKFALAGESPAVAPEKWEKVNIPYAFGSFMSWGSTSNWMASEGMLQEAAVIESKAREILENEYDKVARQQGQFNRLAMVRTY